MDPDFSRTLSDGRAGLPGLLDAIEAHMADHGLPPGAVAPVMIACDEVISNALNHGGAAGSAPTVEVALRLLPGEVAVEVADDGDPFNPLDAAAPDTGLSVDDRAIGGLGIHLVRELMGDVTYERRSGRNHLRFSRRY